MRNKTLSIKGRLIYFAILFVSYAIMVFLVASCNGERENPITYTSTLSNIDKDFVPEFDKVRKSEVFVEIKPKVESEIDPLLEEQGITQDIIERAEEYTQNMESLNDINLDDGFRLVGHYGEDGCLWKIYKKEFEVSYLYIHVDCEGNRIKLQRGK